MPFAFSSPSACDETAGLTSVAMRFLLKGWDFNNTMFSSEAFKLSDSLSESLSEFPNWTKPSANALGSGRARDHPSNGGKSSRTTSNNNNHLNPRQDPTFAPRHHKFLSKLLNPRRSKEEMSNNASKNGVPRGRIIVVGAGYAGLAAAIELTRKGFEVEVVEGLGSNATRVMSNWGNVLEEETKVSGNPSCMNILEKSGKVLLQAPMPTEFDGYPVLFSNRGCLQRLIFEHANSLGIKFRFGTKVESYFEEDDCAGVIINGERLQGDAVIAADGVHSIARKSVMGIHQHPRSSGFAVYRTCFSLDLLGNDPLTKPLTEVKEDTFQVWLGPDVHAILFITVAVRQAVIFCTHKDTYEVEESWSNPGDIKDLLHVVDGWDPVIVAAMKAIPHDKLIDWKLLWRDPIRQWVSPKGRIVLAGDSAHPHLPTSGQGAAQAFEDGATIGVVLDRLGREDIPTAFRAFERLRFERTSLTQRMGWETRHRWHQTDWEAVAADPSFLKMPQPLWLYSFDAEGYADNRLSEVVQSVKGGSPFKSTNLPEGHVHEDWTVESMMALEKEQAKEHFYRVANR
ncbi:hypothetical protein ACJZ2D_001728 [Fusarium nematophilum]